MAIRAVSFPSFSSIEPRFLGKTEDEIATEFIQVPLIQRPRKTARISADEAIDGTVILSQAPHENQLSAFFEIIYQHCDVVIQLHWDFYSLCYFNVWEGDYRAQRTNITEIKPHLEQSILEIRPENGSSKSIHHYHYKDWEDGRGADPVYVAFLAQVVMAAKKPLIHCIAGVGRTGTLACVVKAYKMILAGDHSPQVVANALRSLRNERENSIHSPGQYITVYKALAILLEEAGIVFARPKSCCAIL